MLHNVGTIHYNFNDIEKLSHVATKRYIIIHTTRALAMLLLRVYACREVTITCIHLCRNVMPEELKLLIHFPDRY